MSKFGVGFSENTDSRKAGAEAASQAISNLSSDEESRLCFLFCTSRHQPNEFFEGVKSVAGAAQYIGGFSNGVITNESFGYDGYQCVVGVLESNSINYHMYKQEGIAFNERETGEKLFHQVEAGKYSKKDILILLFDAVNREKGFFQMNFGTPLFEGAGDRLSAWENIVGARLMGDMKFKPTYQWFKGEMIQNAAMALVLSGDIEMHQRVLQGCTPASAYHTVTKAEDAAILEIDNKPALEFASNFLGPSIKDDHQKIKFFVTLGKNQGDKWSRDNSQYVNRMCVGVNPKNNGLIMAESDMGVGTEFQLMRRGFDLNKIESEIRAVVQEVISSGRKPLFAMYFNCAGRATAYSQNNEEDASYVQKAVNNEFPLLGIYEAGELGKVNGTLEVLDWSGIFCLFSTKNVSE
jgi:hypothetical protein